MSAKQERADLFWKELTAEVKKVVRDLYPVSAMQPDVVSRIVEEEIDKRLQDDGECGPLYGRLEN